MKHQEFKWEKFYLFSIYTNSRIIIYVCYFSQWNMIPIKIHLFDINVYIRWNTSRSSDSFYIFRILMPEGRGICSKKIILLKGKSCIFWLNVLGIDLMHLWISVRCWWCLLSFNKCSNNLMKQFLWHYRAMSHYKLEMAIWTIHQNKDCYIQNHNMVMIYAYADNPN